MKVGVPTEVKKDEYRVALTPAGVGVFKHSWEDKERWAFHVKRNRS